MRPQWIQANALERARSPYLRRHADNPVWWQEWSEQVLAVARASSIPLFISVGYATCHWCHVMAREAFSDPEIADILNRDFISIKIDREERPDIDQYLMTFLIATQGSGGWPLNAFLTPDGKPVLALTYIPIEPRGGMPGFSWICSRVLVFLEENGSAIDRFRLDVDTRGTESDRAGGCEGIDELVSTIAGSYDGGYGGFAEGAKFPPHSTLLFLLHAQAICGSARAGEMAEGTLRRMARGGLHDHVGGGFFRYCVDRGWRTPHFEKMLYDQAMTLWVYAEAYGSLGDTWYRQVAEGVYTCLDRDFSDGEGCFVSALDAEADGHEGYPYLWSDAELKQNDGRWALEFFERDSPRAIRGYRHLLRRTDGPVGDDDRMALDRLLARRLQRPQPLRDNKIVTAWNALAAIAMVVASRRLDRGDLRERAVSLYDALAQLNRRSDGSWCRSSVGSIRDEGRFLEDEAAILLLLTYLFEDEADPQRRESLGRELRAAETRLDTFRAGDTGWITARMRDFGVIRADRFDSPTPSSSALAELALQRTALLEHRPGPPLQRGRAIERDFYNLAWLVAAGEYYILERPVPLSWKETPINCIQIYSENETWCVRGACRWGIPESWNTP